MFKGWSVPLTMLVAGSLSTAAVAAGDAVLPASLTWTASGEAALAKGQAGSAIDAFEAALAIDPRNNRAFIGMAHAYEMQGLPGRAVKFYREALVIDPNDLAALEGQGKALIARGATTRARVNLDRIKTLCKADCPAAKRLEVALAAPPVVVAPTASAEPAKPAVAKN